MDTLAQLFAEEFVWLWIELGRNAFFSFFLALPLAISSKKIWPVLLSMFVGLFVIDLHGYVKVLSQLDFPVQPPNGRVITNSYGFEMLVTFGIYLLYVIRAQNKENPKGEWRIEQTYSVLILSVASGFQANIFVDTLIKNDRLFYEPLSTVLDFFVVTNFVEIPLALLFMYIVALFVGNCAFSAIYWMRSKNRET